MKKRSFSLIITPALVAACFTAPATAMPITQHLTQGDTATVQARSIVQGRPTTAIKVRPAKQPILVYVQGIFPSTWTGKKFVRKAEKYRQCIVHRESRGNYRARSTSSSAAGAYQFLQRTWDVTAQRAGHPELVGLRPSRASRLVQDFMFWSAWDMGNGKHHWSSRWGGYPCWPGDH